MVPSMPALAVRERSRAVSFMNVLLCLLVVFIHVSSHPVTALDRRSLSYAVVFIPWRFASFAVPGFFFLSGLRTFYKDPERRGWRAFYLGRIRRVVLPYLFWCAVYYAYFIWRGYEAFSIARFLSGVLTGTIFGPFYFVAALLQFYILAPLWKGLIRRAPPQVALPIAALLTPLFYINFPALLRTITPDWHFPYTDRLCLTYLIYFLAGCYAGERYEAFARLKKRLSLVGAAFGVLAVLDIGLAWAVSSGRLVFVRLEYIHYLYCLAAVAFFMALFFGLENRLPFPGLLRAVDLGSYGIYLLHGLLIYLCNDALASLGVQRVRAAYALRLIFVYSGAVGLTLAFQDIKARLQKEKGRINRPAGRHPR